MPDPAPLTVGLLLRWLLGQVRGLGIAPLILLALVPIAPRVRRAVESGRLGPIVRCWRPAGTQAWAITLWPVALWTVSLVAARGLPSAFLWVTDEDGVVEWLQFACLMAGCGWAAHRAMQLGRSSRWLWAVAYGVATLGLFWIAGEEISWGQRLLGYETPSWLGGLNRQDEMNLHNVGRVDDVLSDWGDRLLLWTAVLSAAFSMTAVRRLRRLQTRLWLPHPVWIPALLCAYSYGAVLDLWFRLHPGRPLTELVSRIQEPKELILYAAVAGFLCLPVEERLI